MNLDALSLLETTPPIYPPEANNAASLAIQQFAKDNGFEFELQNSRLVQYSWRDYKTLPAWLGATSFAATKDAYNIVSGTYMNYPFTMFLMWDNLTDGVQYSRPNEQQRMNYTQQQTTGIVRITLSKLFPQIVLDSNKNDRIQSSLRTEYEKSQRIDLEGDFGQYFDLYVPSGLQINALSLLAPNMMQIIKNHSGLFDVEFNGHELILWTRKTLYHPENMKLLQDALNEQLVYMDRLLLSWSYAPIQKPIDILKKPNIGGSTIKIGRLRMTAKTQLIVICMFFIIFALILITLNE